MEAPSIPRDHARRDGGSPTLAAYFYANDFSIDELLDRYPALSPEDVKASVELGRHWAKIHDDADPRRG